jgi:flagellar basal-body rod modification protein FlgD
MADISSISSSITAAGNTGSAVAASNNTASLAQNFTTFLQLLTTQLKNQNPLEPLDTNQFTQQLVQFAQVEQQMKSNDTLTTLVALQKTAQSTAALDYVGKSVVVDGATARLADGKSAWTFNSAKPANSTFTITNKTGQTVYSTTFALQPGQQDFEWDGRGTNGVQWPDGDYTLSIAAKDASGQSVAVSTEVFGVVDSADLTKSPPIMSIGGQDFTLDKIKRIVRGAS